MKRILPWLLILLLLCGCGTHSDDATPPQYDKIVIAMLDTGISTAAIDAGFLLPGYNYVTSTEDTQDRINHGTATASVIVGCESAGVVGRYPQVLLLPLVVTDKVDGKVTSVSPEVLAQAIMDAVDVYGANIINVSLGIQKDHDKVRRAVEYALGKGIPVISAVGNDGGEVKFYPAAYDGVLGVGSHDEKGNVSSFSQRNDTVDLLAPGEDIWMASRNGAVYGAKGTSYAAAQVSAAAAKLLEEDPALPPEQLTQKLCQTTKDVGKTGWDNDSGWGILDLESIFGK